MSIEVTTPLTKEERGHLSADYLSLAYLRRFEATVRAVEAERDAASARAEKLREALRTHGTCRCDMELSSGLRVATPCGICAALAADDECRRVGLSDIKPPGGFRGGMRTRDPEDDEARQGEVYANPARPDGPDGWGPGADDAERGQSSGGPPMPHPVAVTFLEALRRDFARDPDSVIALLAADDAERGDG